MLYRLRRARTEYPPQYWLLFWGMLISTTGSSMIWPFLMLYVSKTLDLPMTAAAGLMTLNSTMGLIFSFFAGPIADRFGRKWVMAIGLLVNGLVYLLMSGAASYGMFAVIMSISGAFNPLYRVGANAMLTDLVPSEKRADAFALMRLSNNVGVALGPAIGGFIAVSSYDLAFYGAAAGMIFYSLLTAFFARETLPAAQAGSTPKLESFGGYGRVLQDRHFLAMVGSLTFTIVCAGIMWVLLAVYTNQNYGILESQYGLIPMTNALMVVFFQVAVTSTTKRFPPLLMMALGSLFYAVGVGSVALGQGFWAFWGSMVVMTIGELVLVPTSDTYVASLAPVDMRGRYLGVAGLTWSIGTGIGPVIGGVLNDSFGPNTIWYGAMALGFAGTLGFLLLHRRKVTKAPELSAAAQRSPGESR